MQLQELWPLVYSVASGAIEISPGSATFDQLAEEVMELHLAMRGKHEDTPAMEWLEIAGIALNALAECPEQDVMTAIDTWFARHGNQD